MTGGREGIDTSGEARLAEPVVPRSATVSLLGELWSFMRVRKKWWLGPIVLVLALFGALIVFTQGSALAPSSTRSSSPWRAPHARSSAASV